MLNRKVLAKLDAQDSISSYYYMSQVFLFMSYFLEYISWSAGSSNLIAVHLSLLSGFLFFLLVPVDSSTHGTLPLKVCGPKGVGILELV